MVQLDLNLPDLIIRGMFLLIAVGIVWLIIGAIRDAVHQYRMGAVYELEQKEKAIQEANRKLSADKLIKQSNEAMGLGSQSDSESKKGPTGSV
jgi:hypothetical protein